MRMPCRLFGVCWLVVLVAGPAAGTLAGAESVEWPAGVVAAFSTGNEAGFTCCDPLPDGIACGTTDGRLLVFDHRSDNGDGAGDSAGAGRLVAATSLGGEPVLAVRGLPDGRVTACSASGAWQVWDPRTGEKTDVTALPPLELAAFSPDGGRLAALSAEPPIRLHRLGGSSAGDRSGRVDTQVQADRLLFAPDGRRFVSTRFSRLYVWDAASGELIEKLRLASNVEGAAYFPDGKHLLVASDLEGLIVLRADTGETVRRMTDPRPPRWDEESQAVAVSPDGSLCLSTGRDGMVILWESYTGRPADRLRGHTRSIGGVTLLVDVTDVAFLADGRHCVTVDASGVGYVWNLFAVNRNVEDESPLDEQQAAALWQRLADIAEGRGWPALVTLSEHPQVVFRMLDDPPDGRRAIPDLLRQLDAPNYRSRREAAEGLERLGLLAEDALRRFEAASTGGARGTTSQGTTSQARRQVRRLLNRLSGARREVELDRQELAEQVRGLRCVHLLKWIGTEEARARLNDWGRRQGDDAVRAEAQRVLLDWHGRTECETINRSQEHD